MSLTQALIVGLVLPARQQVKISREVCLPLSCRV
jgi:hypothetical protein